jgi:hypothetical protein
MALTAIINEKTVRFSDAGAKIRALMARWQEDQRGSSVVDYTHGAYLQILTMGESAVPYLLEEVESGSGRWFMALKHIAGEVVVPPGARRSLDEVRELWLRWGEKNGYRSNPDGTGKLARKKSA